MPKKSNVTYIHGNYEFYGADRVSMRKIQAREYHNSSYLTDIVLDDSIQVIEEDAFSDCKNLKRIVLPHNLKKIGRDAFSGCHKAKKNRSS